jgi:hypothetical protein
LSMRRFSACAYNCSSVVMTASLLWTKGSF